MSRRQLKREVLAILQQADLEKIFQKLENYQEHRLLNPLFIALCHPQDRVRWHAVCAFGWLVPRIAARDPEAARVVMRRFLWSLNDESGGKGWGVPEAMAEIMCHSSQLRREYLHMLISYMREDGECLFQDGNYLELPLLQRGLLWGIGRLCEEHRLEMVRQALVDDVISYLDSPDLHVVGLAIRCLGLLGDQRGLEKIKRFRHCHETIAFYLNNDLQQVSVAEIVSLSEDALRHRRHPACAQEKPTVHP